MANKQPKQLDETTTAQSTDIYIIQKNSSDVVNKIKAENMLPDGSVTSDKLAEESVIPSKVAGIPVNGDTSEYYQIKTGENVITVGNTITFSTPFPSGIRQVVACYGDTPSSTVGALVVDSEATTGFRVRVSGGSGSIRVCWIAIGY